MMVIIRWDRQQRRPKEELPSRSLDLRFFLGFSSTENVRVLRRVRVRKKNQNFKFGYGNGYGFFILEGTEKRKEYGLF